MAIKYQKRSLFKGASYKAIINNLISYLKNAKVILFADDVQIYLECEVSAINDGIEIINGELVQIIQYGKDYGIEINPTKTKAIILSTKNNLHKLKYADLSDIVVDANKIEYVSEVRNLGYYLNRTLGNDMHINIVHRKVYGSLSSIRPLRNLWPPEIKLQFVKPLIYPIIDYMDVVYDEFGVHGTRGGSDSLEQ